jgi:hypothetical protein
MHIPTAYAIRLGATAAAIFPILSFWKFHSIKVIEDIPLGPLVTSEHPLVTFGNPSHPYKHHYYTTITNSMEYLTNTMIFQTNLPKDLVNLALEYLPHTITSISRTRFEVAVFCRPGGVSLFNPITSVSNELLHHHQSNACIRPLNQAKAELLRAQKGYLEENIEFFMPAFKTYREVAKQYVHNVKHFNKLLLKKIAGASFALYALDKAMEFEEYYWDSDNAVQAGIKLYNNLGKIKDDTFLISPLQHIICDTIGDQGIAKTMCVEATNVALALPKNIEYLGTHLIYGIGTMLNQITTTYNNLVGASKNQAAYTTEEHDEM